MTKPLTRGNNVTLPGGVPFGTMTSYFVRIGGVLNACLTTEFATTSLYEIYNFGGTSNDNSLWVYIGSTSIGNDITPNSGSIFNKNSPVLKCYSRCRDVSTLPVNSNVYFFVHAYLDAYNSETCALTPFGSSTTSGCGCKANNGCACQGSIGEWTMTVPDCPGKFKGDKILHCQSKCCAGSSVRMLKGETPILPSAFVLVLLDCLKLPW